VLAGLINPTQLDHLWGLPLQPYPDEAETVVDPRLCSEAILLVAVELDLVADSDPLFNVVWQCTWDVYLRRLSIDPLIILFFVAANEEVSRDRRNHNR